MNTKPLSAARPPAHVRRWAEAKPFLHLLRQEARVRSRRGLSEDLGLSPNVVSQVLRGRRGIGPKTMAALKARYACLVTKSAKGKRRG